MNAFREYLQQRESTRADQAKQLARSRATKFSADDFLKLHAAQEWAILQDQVWSVVQNEQVSGHRFCRQEHAVSLGTVSVRFVSQASNPSAAACLFDLLFSADAGEAAQPGGFGTGAPVAPDHWKMRAVVSEGDILWTRSDVSSRRAEAAGVMAVQIAKRLVEYFDKVERAAGRDELFSGGVLTPQRG